MSLSTQELEALGKQLLAQMLPVIETAAKDAVAAASPVAAVFADPVIDEIDAYIQSLLGNPVPAVTAPTDPASQIKQLQQHVAALTVSTVGSAQSMATAKVAAANVPAPTAEAAS